MKKILAGVCLAAVLGVAVWRAPCTQWQCDRIVDRAVAEYGIEVPDTADYKAYVWQETQAQGLTARQLKAWFAAGLCRCPRAQSPERRPHRRRVCQHRWGSYGRTAEN